MQNKVRLWSEHPVTQKLLSILKEHRQAHLDRLLNIGTFNHDNLGLIAEIKGYINAIDYITDLESIFEGEHNEEENL